MTCHVAQIWRHPIKSLGALEAHFGHKDFGVYCQVITGRPVAEGDRVEAVAEGDPAGLD